MPNQRSKMTEKNYNPEQKQMKSMQKQKVADKAAAQAPKVEKKKDEEKKPENNVEEKKEETKVENKKLVEKNKTKTKKEDAFVRAQDIPISTKHSIAICDFIRNKKLGEAIEELEEVTKFRKVIPMRGEIPHKHGKGIMAGRYPVKATKNFIKLLRSLAANALYNGLEEPVIVKAVANLGSRPYGKFGAVRRERTHIEIVVKDKIKKEEKKRTEKKDEKLEENKTEGKKVEEEKK